MSLVMMHSNPVRLENSVLHVDRKFLTGMLEYAKHIKVRITTIHPELPVDGLVMDMVQVPCGELPFDIVAIKPGNSSAAITQVLKDCISKSRLVYGGGFNSSAIASSIGVPYILVLEYDLKTQITMATSQVASKLRKWVRTVRNVIRYGVVDVPIMYRAHAFHCNGYPVYDEVSIFKKERLLYLDSRISNEYIISEPQLTSRLEQMGSRPVKLLFTGRYERVKGATDCIEVAVECLRRGLNIEMHTYGQGSMKAHMVETAKQSGYSSKIHIHDAVPYPVLVEKAREFDLFICCHIQNDPSCTYIESFGAGLPIVGYANRMWNRLAAISECGYASPIGNIEAVADSVTHLLGNVPMLVSMSRRARDFALEHTFEKEFSRRIDHINATLLNTPATV